MPARPPTRRRPRPPGSTTRRERKPPAQVELDRFIDTRPWRRLRKAYLAEHPLCEGCLDESLVRAAEHVHHVASRAERPDLALCWENLRALCAPCHSRATAAERASGRGEGGR